MRPEPQAPSGFDVAGDVAGAIVVVVLAIAKYRAWRAARTPPPDGAGEAMPEPSPVDHDVDQDVVDEDAAEPAAS